MDLDKAEQRFAQATDLTVGIEEEFALLDPATLDLVPRFEELRELARERDPLLADSIAGELIRSEIEIVSGRGETFADALGAAARAPPPSVRAGGRSVVALAATGTHPWADYREQAIIDTEHYRRVEQGLKYVAWRNNTFSLHVHVGVRDIDRAVRVCDRLRPVLPLLLAVSANSPYLDGRDSGLAFGAHAELHAQLPPLRHPRRLRLAGRPIASTSSSCCAPARSSSSRRCGGRCARTSSSGPSRSGSATPRARRRSPRRWRR